MNFLCNNSNLDRALALFRRFKALHYHPFFQQARYGSVYLFVHGPTGTAGIRLADHPSHRPMNIIRPGREMKKVTIDLGSEHLSDAQVIAVVSESIPPFAA